MDEPAATSTDSPTRSELAKELLLYKMREYSEEYHCAGWLGGLEYHIWEAAKQETQTKLQKLIVPISRQLRNLGMIAGGWWVYEDETCPAERGPVFITMERWQKLLAEQEAEP